MNKLLIKKFVYGILYLIKKTGRNIETVWNPDTLLEHGDQLTVIGQEKAIIDVFKRGSPQIITAFSASCN